MPSLDSLKENLQKMAKYKMILGEEYASRAYDNAIKVLVSDQVVHRILDGSSLPRGIGSGIRDKIIEYYATGSIKELSELRMDPKVSALEKFETIIGIGPVNASKFVSQGFLTLESLKGADLNSMQRIGLEYSGKIMIRIPRDIITCVFEEIKRNISEDCIITGSYRRGAKTSGDVDILVSSDTLKANDLNIPGAIDLVSGPQKRAFLYPLKSGMYVQVDIFISPKNEYILHLNYSTGSANHNILLRSKAKKMGYKLSQHSLSKDDKEILLESEEELYSLLGLKYVEPEDRV